MTTSNDTSRLIPSMSAVLALLLLIGAGLLYFLWPQANPNDSQANFGRIVATAQTARAIAADRLTGGPADASALDKIATTIENQWSALTSSAGRRATLGALAAAGDEVETTVIALREFVANNDSLERVDQAVDRLQRLSPQLLASARSLFAGAGEASSQANQSYLGWLEQAVVGVQSSLAARSADRSPAELLARLREDEQTIEAVIGGITGTRDTLGITSVTASADPVDVDTTLRLFDEVKLAAAGVLREEESLERSVAAYSSLDSGAQALAIRFQNSRPAQTVDRDWVRWAVIGMLGVALLLLLGLVIGFFRARQLSETADVHAEQNERNQQAILRLLDELSNLADGDLTVQATVTEDITGAIADSINYAIEALRELVITVNESSILVDAAAKQSEATAHHMVRASETQVKQAAGASNSMLQMTASVEEVSGNAERCSDVARHSVEVAHKGGEAVRRTIEGMNTIRETIQDTSKRIKRLGESSQEIGNIVELIEEIADQTNILALNASIEASRAGEASRGFAVVADEVQKLAERSTAATRKIEVLVSTIQSDTNEAVVSMERSTTDVVGGALLAENAGAALEEIEQVSHQIASLVQNISGSAREQGVAAQAITRNMDVLRDVSAKTKQSTTATSSSISKLSELASQLRKTVSGFTLPHSQRQVAGPQVASQSEQPTAETNNTAETLEPTHNAAVDMAHNDQLNVQPEAVGERR